MPPEGFHFYFCSKFLRVANTLSVWLEEPPRAFRRISQHVLAYMFWLY